MRVGSAALDADELELGCAFEMPLRDEETVMLGIGLPAIGVTTAAAYKDVPQPKRRGAPDTEGAKPQAYDGILHPGAGHSAEPLAGVTHGLLDDTIWLTFPLSGFPGASGAESASILPGLRDAFGEVPRIEILDGLHMVWSGPVHLLEIEVPPGSQGDALLLLKPA